MRCARLALKSILPLCLLALLAWPAPAQEEEPPAAGGIEVRPPAPAQEAAPEDTTPPPTPPEDDGLSQSYPGLSELTLGQDGPFGANTGVLRSQQSLFDTPQAVGVVTRREIVEKQAPDMFHALQNEVGVLMQSTAAGQASPFVRGLTGQQVLMLVDGIRLNNSVYRRGPNQYFNTVDIGMVDHIEVHRGPASVLWGSDAIGGAINVVTRGPDIGYGLCCGDYSGREHTQYYNTANSSSYSRLNVEGWAANSGVFAGGSFFNVRDLDTGFDFGRQPGTNYQQWAGDIKYNVLLEKRQMLTLALQHFQQDDVPRSDRFPGFPGDLNDSNTLAGARFFDPQQRDLAYVRYQALSPSPAIDALTLTGSYHRQRENQKRGVPTTRFQEIDVETVGLNAVAAKQARFGKWTLGADWYYDDVDSPFGGAASGPIVPDDAWYRRFGAFLFWDVPLTCRLTATAGVRYESIETAGTPVIADNPVFINPSYDDWMGQVGLVYALNPCVRLVGSISEGFRAPNLDDLMANNPNVLQEEESVPSLGLAPEHAITYEVGVKTDLDRLRTQTFVFWTDLQDNLTSIAVERGVFATANQDSLVQGLEHQAELLLADGWSVYGNFWYTYGKNRVTGSPLSRIPPAQGILGLRWRDPHLRSYFAIYTWMVRRQDRLEQVRDITDERIPPGGTPGYATLNLRVGRTYGRCDQHRLSLSLENITDKAYLVHGSGVFGTGFTARFGYTWVY